MHRIILTIATILFCAATVYADPISTNIEGDDKLSKCWDCVWDIVDYWPKPEDVTREVCLGWVVHLRECEQACTKEGIPEALNEIKRIGVLCTKVFYGTYDPDK